MHGRAKEPSRPKAAAALAYDPAEDRAPRIVAAGRGRLAALIEELARQSGVPVYRHGELAEALAALGAGREVPPELYRAVAEVIAWVYALDKRAKT
ncbi:EscU/YscU/HrcU family type III secretion system export apparatus switch protein [Desulfovirgula thermocuniculi]|mgnify:CR=1 FL=1|uniref:EscU/YscU/HrcU family type III secretion system export apparatus switch protein n=1 Tax=Desulfovirgula thermocuniculi TaxID=348842 RepID=UPI000427AE67|nr:EscU/YscU/HrcU family type III secretion system export apparatus switch protein [Desulfovirgula thermocuniculi]